MFKETSIGIDFGGYSMKVSAFIEKLDDYVKREYVMSAEINDIERYFEEAGKNLNAFKKENRISFAALSISLPSNIPFLSGMGYAEFPAQKDKILRKALGYEVQKDMKVVSLNNYEYLYENIGNFKDENGNSNVALLYNVLSKDVIFELKKFVNVKTKIINVFLHPMSLVTKGDNSAVLLDFGFRCIKVYMYEKDVLQNVEIIEFGEAEIDGAIRNIVGFSHDEDYLTIKKMCSILREEDAFPTGNESNEQSEIEARYQEELDKYKNSFASEDSVSSTLSKEDLIRDCSVAITEELIEAVQRIKQAVRAYEISKEITFENFYVMGGITNFQNLNEFLSEEFSTPISHLNKHRDLLEFSSAEEEQNFIVASTLSHLGTTETIQPLNFRKFTRFTVDMPPIFIGILCVTMMVNGIAYKINQEYNTKLDELTNQFASSSNELTSSRAETQRMKDSISEVEFLVSSSNKIEIQKKWLSDIFKVLKKITPSELLVYKIDSRDDIITFHGFSSNYSDIGFFSLALKEYGKVTIKSIEKAKEIKLLNTIELVEEFFITLEYEGKLMENALGGE